MNRVHVGSHRKGVAYIVAIIVLACAVSVAAAFAAFASVSARSGKNARDIHRAQLAAEGGLAFALHHIRLIPLPYATNDGTVIANVATSLGQRLDGTSNLGGWTVTHTLDTVSVPRITTDDGAFEFYVYQRADNSLKLEVHGLYNGTRRVVAMDLALADDHPLSVFNYGIASRGTISIGGNAEVLGKNSMTEASIVSVANNPVAVNIEGNAVLDGDISTTGDPTTVVLTGSPTIAGSTDPAVIAEHVHFGVEPPAFPEVDTSIFRNMTTSEINSTTVINVAGQVFENVLIKAGTNPTFSKDVVFNGVVYVEEPNILSFTSKVTLNAVVATDQTRSYPLEACKIKFSGQVQATGVETLPDLPQFEQIKQLPGTFVVAPGFDVSFEGQFATVNGTIAADKLLFSGTAIGTVNGSVIGLANNPTSVYGTVDICFDRSGDPTPDPGFLPAKCLAVTPRSYEEVPPGGVVPGSYQEL